MIGVIGPEDSVQRVEEVASTIEISTKLFTRVYHDVEEINQLTHESALACRVILFTGLIPYSIAVDSSEGSDATLLYIEHSASDLYGGISRLLIDGRISADDRISVDLVSSRTTLEVFKDLGLPSPEILELSRKANADVISDDLVERHARMLNSQKTSFALTCLDAVARGLSSEGLPHYRLPHTQATIRDALANAANQAWMRSATDGKAAVAMMRYPDAPPDGPMTAWGQQFARQLSSVGFQTAEKDTIIVQTTRGAVEDYIRRAPDRIEGSGYMQPYVGFGFGTTLARAQAEASSAVSYSEQTNSSCSVFEDGAPRTLFSRTPGVDESQVNAVQRRAAALNISPFILHKTINALRTLDHSSFTADEFAAAYGASSRTARRLISRLRRANIIRQTGIERAPGAGRPQAIFTADIHRIMLEDDEV